MSAVADKLLKPALTRGMNDRSGPSAGASRRRRSQARKLRADEDTTALNATNVRSPDRAGVGESAAGGSSIMARSRAAADPGWATAGTGPYHAKLPS